MSVQVSLLNEFQRRLKRLARKFRTLNDETDQLIDALEINPQRGKSLGGGLYKIRLGSTSKGGGKRGGFRVITYYVEQTAEGEVVYMVTIYDKSEESSISKDDLLDLLARELTE